MTFSENNLRLEYLQQSLCLLFEFEQTEIFFLSLEDECFTHSVLIHRGRLQKLIQFLINYNDQQNRAEFINSLVPLLEQNYSRSFLLVNHKRSGKNHKFGEFKMIFKLSIQGSCKIRSGWACPQHWHILLEAINQPLILWENNCERFFSKLKF